MVLRHDIYSVVVELKRIGDGQLLALAGVTCHTSRETLALLHEKVPERVISLRGDKWPPRSCDLTSCDFFLWRFVKSKVYANKPSTILQLQAESRACDGRH